MSLLFWFLVAVLCLFVCSVVFLVWSGLCTSPSSALLLWPMIKIGQYNVYLMEHVSHSEWIDLAKAKRRLEEKNACDTT